MTFQQLEYILEVSKTGSVSRAAENLFVSRSSISSSITSLENELGYPIFVRTQQGLIPSSTGKQFLRYADRICQTQRLMTSLEQPSQVRQITIGISDYEPVCQAAVSLMEEYRDRRDLRFSIGIYSFDEIVEKLSVFEMDAAVFCRMGNIQMKLETMLEKHGLQWRVIGSAPTVVMIGKGHPLYDKPDLQLRDLENSTFIDIMSKDISKNTYLGSVMKIDRERIFSTNSSALRYSLLRQGIGFAIGRKPADQSIRTHGLRCVPIPELEQPLVSVVNPARPLCPEAARFLELLEEKLNASQSQS